MGGADDRPGDWTYREKYGYRKSIEKISASQNYTELYGYMVGRLYELAERPWSEVEYIVTDELITAAYTLDRKLNKYGCLANLDEFTEKVARVLTRKGVSGLPTYGSSWCDWSENVQIIAYDSFRNSLAAEICSAAMLSKNPARGPIVLTKNKIGGEKNERCR